MVEELGGAVRGVGGWVRDEPDFGDIDAGDEEIVVGADGDFFDPGAVGELVDLMGWVFPGVVARGKRGRQRWGEGSGQESANGESRAWEMHLGWLLS